MQGVRLETSTSPAGGRSASRRQSAYNISTPCFHLADYAERVQDMHFMLQKVVSAWFPDASGIPLLLDVPRNHSSGTQSGFGRRQAGPRPACRFVSCEIGAAREGGCHGVPNDARYFRNTLQSLLTTRFCRLGVEPTARAKTSGGGLPPNRRLSWRVPRLDALLDAAGTDSEQRVGRAPAHQTRREGTAATRPEQGPPGAPRR